MNKPRYRRPKITIAGKQMLVSRVTMSRFLKRELESSEIVHHRDGDPCNNAIENLQIVTRAEHKRIHADVGSSTRLQKVWKLDAVDIAKRFETESLNEIARSLECSPPTISRLLKTLPNSAGANSRPHQRKQK